MFHYFRKKKIAQVIENLFDGSYDPYWGNVVLHMHMDGTNGATSFIDEKGKIVTSFGGAALSTANYKFGASSGLFASNKYLSLPASSDWDLFSVDSFTVECWVNLSALSDHALISRTSWDSTNKWRGWMLGIYAGGSQIGFNTAVGNDTSSHSPFISYSFQINTWYHIAGVKSGNLLYLFVNGTLVGTQTFGAFTTPSGVLTVSRISVEAIPEYNFNGYIDEVRITKGIARYTADFTVSSTPFPSGVFEPDYDIYWDQTVLSLHGSRTDLSDTTFVESANNLTIAKNGTITQTYSGPFAGAGAFQFTGTAGNYLTLPSSANIGGTADDFTVEFFINFNVLAAEKQPVSGQVSNEINWAFYTTASNTLNLYLSSNGSTWDIASGNSLGTIASNTWYHVALTKQGTTYRAFLNGVKTIEFVNSSNVYAHNLPISLGGMNTGCNANCKISNFRIVKGNALYTTGFSVPAENLTVVAGTSALLKAYYGSTLNNHTFFDSSVNHAIVTRAGNVSQGAFSPFAGQGGSAYFDGAGDYLTFDPTNSFNFGTGDFTVEFWAYMPNASTYSRQIFVPVSASGFFCIEVSTRTIAVSLDNSSAVNHLTWDTLPSVSANVWHHIAVTRVSGTVTLWINGVSVASKTLTNNVVPYGTTAYIAHTAYSMSGYMSNVRVVKGSAVYMSAFTVPIVPLTAIANTSLLLKFEDAGIVDATRTVDLETSSNTLITANGKYGATGLRFDGASWMRPVDNKPFVVGTGDFTFETWVKLSATSGAFFGTYPTSGATGLSIYMNAGKFSYEVNGLPVIASTTTLAVGQWYHVALSRVKGIARIFVNGSMEASAADTSDFNPAAGRPSIGASAFSNMTSGFLNGYVDDMRFARVGRYVTSFIPRMRSQSADAGPSFDPFWDKVCMAIDGEQASIYDICGHAFTNNSVTQSSSVYKYGTKSLYFNGSSYIETSASSTDFGLGTDDYTIEFWMYPTVVTNHVIVNVANLTGPQIDIESSKLVLRYNNTIKVTGATALTSNSWYHVAVVRRQAKTYLYLNGRLDATFADTQNCGTTGLVTIGIDSASHGAWKYSGYIDELRITRGFARYIKNFAPAKLLLSDYVYPGTGLVYDPYWNHTVLSVPFTGTNNSTIFTDLKGHTATLTGSPVITTSDYKFGSTSGYFDGASRFNFASSMDFNLPEDFTVEFWAKPTSDNGSFPALLAIGDYTNGILLRSYSSSGSSQCCMLANTYMTTPQRIIPLNVWSHIALTRQGTTVRLFVNGEIVGTMTSSANLNPSGAGVFGYCLPSVSQYGAGYMDDLRITKGKARYVGNFTVPTSAFPSEGAVF